MAQCILVESAMHSGKKPQCILVKSDEFENLYSLLYILLKSCLCCCSLATLAPQQLCTLIFFSLFSLFYILFYFFEDISIIGCYL